MVGSLLGGTDPNYVAYKSCVLRAISDGQNQRELVEKAVLTRQKELEDEAGLNRLRKETENGAWLTAIPHCLNGTEF